MLTASRTKRRNDPSLVTTIDWSDWAGANKEADCNGMIAWVRSSPKRHTIHVYLGSQRRSAEGRKLASALLALGCKVTITSVAESRKR